MRYIKNLLVLTVTVLLTGPFAFGQDEIAIDSTTDTRVEEEDVELVAPSLEWEVDEDTARDMCKLLYAKTYGKSTKIPWNEIQARVYPVYSYDGKRKYYLGLVYYGEGEMPDHEEMMESIKEGYEASKKRTELEMSGKDVPQELKTKIGYMSGCDKNHNQNYWSTTVPASKSRGAGGVVSHGMHYAFSHYYAAIDSVEERFDVSDAEAVGTIYDAGGAYIKVRGDDVLYFAQVGPPGNVHLEGEMAELSANRTNKLEPLDWLLRIQADWERKLDEIERYNSGEPIDYPEEDEGGGSKGSGIKQEYRDNHPGYEDTPGYYQHSLRAPPGGGYTDNWGCFLTSYADVIAWEMWYCDQQGWLDIQNCWDIPLDEEGDAYEYEHTEQEFGDLGILGGAACDDGSSWDSDSLYGYADDAGDPWGVDALEMMEAAHNWFEDHFAPSAPGNNWKQDLTTVYVDQNPNSVITFFYRYEEHLVTEEKDLPWRFVGYPPDDPSVNHAVTIYWANEEEGHKRLYGFTGWDIGIKQEEMYQPDLWDSSVRSDIMNYDRPHADDGYPYTPLPEKNVSIFEDKVQINWTTYDERWVVKYEVYTENENEEPYLIGYSEPNKLAGDKNNYSFEYVPKGWETGKYWIEVVYNYGDTLKVE